MMQEVEVLKTIQELICSFFSEEQFTLSYSKCRLTNKKTSATLYNIDYNMLFRNEDYYAENTDC